MKKATQRIISLIICVLMLFGTAPLNGIVELDFSKLNLFSGIDLPKINLPKLSLGSVFETKASAESATKKYDLLTYIIEDKKVTITDCDYSSNGIIRIPETIEGYSVTRIGDYAFSDRSELKSIDIPDTITDIGHHAFSRCYELTQIIIPESVTNIGNSAFSYCNSITSISIPDRVTQINGYMFADCEKLKSIVIGCGVSNISNQHIFLRCPELESILVSSQNTFYKSKNNCIIEIESKTLVLGCKSSVIPDDGSVLSIGKSAFENCIGLTSITIPNPVISIRDFAFSGCTNLKRIEISDSIISISNKAFESCSKLENIIVSKENQHWHSSGNCLINTSAKQLMIGCNNSIIPKDGSVIRIESNAFSRRNGLTSIDIPNSVKSIGDYAFVYCTGLTSITIPDSVTTIGYMAFDGCSNLISINLPEGITEINGCLFSGCSKLTELSIPDSVTSIGHQAFSGCSGLTSLMIPQSVKNIGYSAFSGCSGLTSITIPEGVTTIESYLFNNCSGLIEISIPDSVTTMENGVFSGCSGITSISIPENSTSIGEQTFSGCKNLKSITIPDSVTSIGGWAFYDCNSLETIIIPDSVTTIGNYAFAYCTGLTSITIPDSVTVIGNNAFKSVPNISYSDNMTAVGSPWEAYYVNGCVDGYLVFDNDSKNKLLRCATTATVINIPEGVKVIDDNSFSDCTKLTSISLPSSITRIGSKAFYNCLNIKSIYYNAKNVDNLTAQASNVFYRAGTLGEGIELTFGDGVEKLPEYLFYVTLCDDSPSIKSVHIGNSIKSISRGMFANCSGLKNITIPESIKSIEPMAFYHCSRLTSIDIPNSVKSIGDYAFAYCTGLTSLFIPDSVTSIGYNAFTAIPNITFSQTMTAIGSPWDARSVNGFVDGYLVYSDKNKTELRVCSIAATGDVKLPETVNTIRENAFNSCTQLNTIEVPNTVTSIGEKAFYLVTNIRYSNNMTAEGSPWGAKTVDAYIENGLVYYDETKTVLTACLDEAVVNGAVTVPNTVREVGEFAFTGCYEVEEITFESADVIDFDSTCFADCDNLETVSSPNTDGDITYMLDEPYAYHKAIKKSGAKNAPARLKVSGEDSGVDFIEMNGILFCNRNKSGEYIIPDRIKYICENAFANCKNLTINLDNCNLRRIGRNAFLNSGNYSSWDKSGLFTIGSYIISASNKLSSLTVTSQYLCIADSAFENCDVLESVSFSGNGTYIGKNAFEGTPYIENEENWENGALYIGGQLIRAKTDLSGAFTVKSGTMSIADGAFANCTGVTSIIIPATVTQIGDNAFEYCYNIESVNLGGVETIGNYAFRDCSSLCSIFVPESVEKIGDYAFMNCNALSSFNVDQANENFKSADGVLFSKNGASLIQYPAGKANIEEYNVDALDECVRIESLAFRNCKNIENVIASVKNKENPDGTIELGYRNPFAKSSALFNNGYVIIQETCLKGWTDDTSTEFIVPEGIKSIGSNAFEGKANLTSITFNESLEEIGDSAFFGCIGLTDIVFPASLQEIGNSAFENCENLSSVEFSLNDGGSNTSLSEIGICAFAGCADNIEFINRDRLDKLGDNVGNCAFGHEDEVIESVRHEKLPTCTKPGIDSVIKYCEVCGAEHTAIDKKETVEPLGHSFTNYTYNNDATAEEDGTETSKCDRCDETDTRTVAGSKNLTNYDIALKYADDNSSLTIIATNKDDPGVIITQTAQAETTEIEPTCTEHGSITYKYTFTGILAPLSTEKTVKGKSKLGHSFTNYVYNNDATIEKDGHETAKCDRCDETDTRIKPGTRITASQAVIRTGASRMVDYRSKVTVTAEADNVPKGYFLAIYEGNKLLIRGTNKSVSYTIDEMTEGKTFTVRVIDDKGNVQTGADYNLLQKEIEVKVKSGFFDKIIAFFRALFHALPEVDIKP